MTDQTELRRLLEEATPGPWEFDSFGEDEPEVNAWAHRFIGNTIPDENGHYQIIATTEDGHGPNADLIVTAVNALPELLDDLAKAEGHRDNLAAALLEVQREKRHLVEALERVKAMHQPYETGKCRECSPAPYSIQSISWPCPTYRATHQGEERMTNEIDPMDRLLTDEEKMRDLAHWALRTASRLALLPEWEMEDNYATTETFYALMREWQGKNIDRQEAFALAGMVDDRCPCISELAGALGGPCPECGHSTYSHDVYGCFEPREDDDE